MPFISLSHTRGFVCCAVSQAPVGVDCERYRRVTEGAMRRVCTPAELADIAAAADPTARFLQYWTLKESISKKRGRRTFGILSGLCGPLRGGEAGLSRPQAAF